MAALFASNGEIIIDGRDDVRGKARSLPIFARNFGHGQDGLPPGAIATRLELQPAINLAADGKSQGRWHGTLISMAFPPRLGSAILENGYVNDHGVWKIQTLHIYPQFAGPYDKGWRDVDADQKIVPYHYTPDARRAFPIPPLRSDAELPKLAGKHSGPTCTA